MKTKKTWNNTARNEHPITHSANRTAIAQMYYHFFDRNNGFTKIEKTLSKNKRSPKRKLERTETQMKETGIVIFVRKAAKRI